MGADIAVDDVRVLKSSFKTSKYCLGKTLSGQAVSDPAAYDGIDHCQLALAEIVVERAAFYEERLKTSRDPTSQEDSRLVNRLSSDYLSLRIALVSIVATSGYLGGGIILAEEAIGVAARASRSCEAHAKQIKS